MGVCCTVFKVFPWEGYSREEAEWDCGVAGPLGGSSGGGGGLRGGGSFEYCYGGFGRTCTYGLISKRTSRRGAGAASRYGGSGSRGAILRIWTSKKR